MQTPCLATVKGVFNGPEVQSKPHLVTDLKALIAEGKIKEDPKQLAVVRRTLFLIDYRSTHSMNTQHRSQMPCRSLLHTRQSINL